MRGKWNRQARVQAPSGHVALLRSTRSVCVACAPAGPAQIRIHPPTVRAHGDRQTHTRNLSLI